VFLREKRKEIMNIKLEIVDIVKETENTKSFILKDIDSKILDFKPGQYITLKIIYNGELIIRSYSISSLPDLLPLLRITIKHNINSPSYTQFSQNLTVGDILTAEPIEGYFYVRENKSINNYLFIAAGSGITPIISMIKSLLKKKKTAKVKLLYQNRDEENVIFYEELINLKNRYNNFEVDFYFSKPVSYSEPKKLSTDLLSLFYLKNKEFLDNSEIFVCGPNRFIDMVFVTFKDFGIKEERLFREIYVDKTVITT
jgi:ring-1,2-phenylacetyl-CoA epoxidase subunit PaaE